MAASLLEVRERIGLSQKAIAEVLRVPPNTWARWERGELPVRHPELLRRALRDLERERRE